MTIRRVVPDIHVRSIDDSRDFYGALGFVEVMDQGWVTTMASPSNPTAQVTIMGEDATASQNPDMSIEVDDVDAVYRTMVARGATIVHPLRDEEWGVRRFFVLDPDGRVVNVLGHRA
ncbi:VOC family protein [Prescottella soli]|uniref:VOC family protein n=1 Tax=Prescottella soli TaxID=1543852 RepID=A0ABW9FXS4_9NOCA|nr:catechol 2,3-dioxygenase-like lactoylglutathione lyase family enzyme [Rhodococcus sp. LBL1]MDH6685783.1 catechol 2,3-dioxygenase-like lactoylglutathione lyase family enzyme [Rhodococcus sp. LBL2]